MPRQVKIYNGHPDNGGQLIRIISRKELEIRGDKILKNGRKLFSSKSKKTPPQIPEDK